MNKQLTVFFFSVVLFTSVNVTNASDSGFSCVSQQQLQEGNKKSSSSNIILQDGIKSASLADVLSVLKEAFRNYNQYHVDKAAPRTSIGLLDINSSKPVQVLQLDKATASFKVKREWYAEGGFNIWLVELGGKYKKSEITTLTMGMEIDKGDHPSIKTHSMGPLEPEKLKRRIACFLEGITEAMQVSGTDSSDNMPKLKTNVILEFNFVIEKSISGGFVLSLFSLGMGKSIERSHTIKLELNQVSVTPKPVLDIK